MHLGKTMAAEGVRHAALEVATVDWVASGRRCRERDCEHDDLPWIQAQKGEETKAQIQKGYQPRKGLYGQIISQLLTPASS